jgi:hypothetical protein
MMPSDAGRVQEGLRKRWFFLRGCVVASGAGME